MCMNKCEGFTSFVGHLCGHGSKTTIPVLTSLRAITNDEGEIIVL